MGTIHATSNFSTLQNAFVMLHDRVNRFAQDIDIENGKRTLFNTGFYITEPLDLGMNVDWYTTPVKESKGLDLVIGSKMVSTIEVLPTHHGTILSVHLSDVDLWEDFASLHVYLASFLKGRMLPHSIYYNITKLGMSAEHCSAQSDYYKDAEDCGDPSY